MRNENEKTTGDNVVATLENTHINNNVTAHTVINNQPWPPPPPPRPPRPQTSERSLLVRNENAKSVQFYRYHRYDPLCRFLMESKIIPQNVRYLERQPGNFKYVIALGDTKLHEPRFCDHDQEIIIDSDGLIHERPMDYDSTEKTVAHHHDNFVRITTTNEFERDLYAVLGLDMATQRRKHEDQQIDDIENAFKEKIRRYHPDCNGGGGNEVIAKEVIAAWKILRDPHQRCGYHNRYDFNDWSKLMNKPRSTLYPERVVNGRISRCVAWNRVLSTLASLSISASGFVLDATLEAKYKYVSWGLVSAGLFGFFENFRFESTVLSWAMKISVTIAGISKPSPGLHERLAIIGIFAIWTGWTCEDYSPLPVDQLFASMAARDPHVLSEYNDIGTRTKYS